MKIQVPRGTRDVLPNESEYWQWIEETVREVTALYGMREIRTPVFEHTELFLRGVGDTTDVVEKQMYTFDDKSGRSLTLKPEGTAGVVRSLVENSLTAGRMPLKLFYISPVFRYEAPQKGRFREHHQFGVEVFGASGPDVEAEIIHLAMNLFGRLGITSLSTRINSIGCPDCRPRYAQALKAYFQESMSSMCKVCSGRFERNPLRILDCKEEGCKRIAAGAPKTLDYLCDDCKTHFEHFQTLLSVHDIAYQVDPFIVRGLDYYTRTVFELIMTLPDGTELTVCGGGRYDGLVEALGGQSMPAAGFGMGLERLYMLLSEAFPPNRPLYDAVVLAMGEEAHLAAVRLVDQLRARGICADYDPLQRSLKAQFKWADKTGARYGLIIGSDELAQNACKVRDLRGTGDREERLIRLDQAADELKTLLENGKGAEA